MARAKAILERWGKSLKPARATYDTVREELATFLRPEQLGFTGRRATGDKRTERLFDSTGINANQLFGASMAGNLTNASTRWFDLVVTHPDLQDLDEVRDHLDERTRIMLAALAEANFYAELLECYYDLGAFGMYALFCEEMPIERPGFNGLRFEAWPLSSVWIQEDAVKRVRTVYHEVCLTAGQVVERYPKTASRPTQDKATKDPDTEVKVLHAIYPREVDTPKQFALASCILEIDQAHELDAGGYHELPVVVPRWSRRTNEIYGTGPGHWALPDVKSLNKLIELYLKGLGKSIDPPLVARHRGILSAIRLTPGGTTYVEDIDDLREFQTNLGKFAVTDQGIERLQGRVEDRFFARQLQLPTEGPQMTAREVLIRYEIAQRLFGPSLGRLMAEGYAPLITRVNGLLERAGQFPPLPEAMVNAEWTVQYQSPLARAQRLSEVDDTSAWLADVKAMSETWPSVADVADADEAARFLGERRGVAPKIVRDADATAKVREQAAALMRVRQAKVEAGEQAEAVAKLTSATRGQGPAANGTAAATA